MLCKYIDDSLVTFERIKGTISSYTPNKVYKNSMYNIYWYINSQGYMHILRPCNVRIDGKIIYYTIEDCLLTKDNMLKSTGHRGIFESLNSVVEELEKCMA